MKKNARLRSLIITSLSQSMSVAHMEKLAARVVPDYNLHRQTGYPDSLAIPQLGAAQQIADDMLREGTIRRFAEVLIDIDRDGIMGRSVAIRALPQIIDEIESLGFLYNEEYGFFIEGEGVKTNSWGILREELIYEFSFLSIDIVRNSELVREFPENLISSAYADIKNIIKTVVENRDGRMWSWEGDGSLSAFYFANKNIQAALSGMEILLELFMYNLFDCPLKKPIDVRMAVHTGPCYFSNNIKEIQSDTLRRLKLIESKYADANSFVISPGVYSDMGTKMACFFRPLQVSKGNFLYKYRVAWD